MTHKQQIQSHGHSQKTFFHCSTRVHFISRVVVFLFLYIEDQMCCFIVLKSKLIDLLPCTDQITQKSEKLQMFTDKTLIFSEWDWLWTRFSCFRYDLSHFSTIGPNCFLCLTIPFHADPAQPVRIWFYFPLWCW